MKAATNFEKFDIDVAKLQREIGEDTLDVYRDLCLAVVEAAVAGNPRYSCPGVPVDTGFARGSWVVSFGAPASTGPADPDKDRPVALDTAAILGATLDAPLFVTSFVVYMKRLEYEGWSMQAPRGFVRLAISAGPYLLRDLKKERRRARR